MIRLEILVRIQPYKRMEFLQVFDMSAESGSEQDKRIGFQLFAQVQETNTFLWLEEWDDPNALALYCKDSKFRATMGEISILGELIHCKHLVCEEDFTNG